MGNSLKSTPFWILGVDVSSVTLGQSQVLTRKETRSEAITAARQKFSEGSDVVIVEVIEEMVHVSDPR